MRITRQDFEEVLDFVRDPYDQRGLEDFADRTMGSCRVSSRPTALCGGFLTSSVQSALAAMQPSVVRDHDGTGGRHRQWSAGGPRGSFGSHPCSATTSRRGRTPAESLAGHDAGAVSAILRDRRIRPAARRQYQMGAFFTAGPTVVTAVLLARNQRDFRASAPS
jgi:hypothetical protein